MRTDDEALNPAATMTHTLALIWLYLDQISPMVKLAVGVFVVGLTVTFLIIWMASIMWDAIHEKP